MICTNTDSLPTQILGLIDWTVLCVWSVVVVWCGVVRW